MAITLAGHEFERVKIVGKSNLPPVDHLGYPFRWDSRILIPELTAWGTGDRKPEDAPLLIGMQSKTEDVPLPRQQAALEWFLSNVDDAVARIQAVCEMAWQEPYNWPKDHPYGLGERQSYWATRVEIPPGEVMDWPPSPDLIASIIPAGATIMGKPNLDMFPKPRDLSLPALVVVELEQNWDAEHGFFAVLDPTDTAGDSWATWDGLRDLGLHYDDFIDESFKHLKHR